MTPSRTDLKPDKPLIRKAQAVYRTLQDFYGTPEWRQPLPPIDELVSTILSQNTNDTNRDVAFSRLKERYTSWEAVCLAPPQDVIDAIRSAGLANQKGPRIQSILKQIAEERGSINLGFLSGWERDAAHIWLSRFKGVGPKTAAIVLQFSLGIPAFPVDTHIYRVSGRLGLRPADMDVERTHAWLETLFMPEQYGTGHLNLIRLGREICQARKPLCPACPLRRVCDYFKESG
jgi:endonuclease-3